MRSVAAELTEQLDIRKTFSPLQFCNALTKIRFDLQAPFTLYRIAIVAPQLSGRIGVLFTSHQSYPIQDAPRIGAKITSLRR